jgi:hypothetical protein
MFKYSFFPVRRRFIHKSRNGSHIQIMGQLACGLRLQSESRAKKSKQTGALAFKNNR